MQINAEDTTNQKQYSRGICRIGAPIPEAAPPPQPLAR